MAASERHERAVAAAAAPSPGRRARGAAPAAPRAPPTGTTQGPVATGCRAAWARCSRGRRRRSRAAAVDHPRGRHSALVTAGHSEADLRSYSEVVQVSTRGDYASSALLSLALHADESGPTSVRDIAERTGLPQPYLEQILLALKGAGLVRSKRGVGGGYVLARPPAEISLSEIVSAVDGPDRRSATSGSRTPTAPATTRASACCSRSGPTSASRCAPSSTRTPWPTSPRRPAASGPGRPADAASALTRSSPASTARKSAGSGDSKLDSLARSPGGRRRALARAAAAAARGSARERPP